MENWPQPRTAKEVRSFIGHCSYYRRYVKDFARVAAPLHSVITQDKDFEWNDSCSEAFTELKKSLRTAPILIYPDPNLPFILDTDARTIGTGCVLSKVEPKEEQMVAYCSRSSNKSEKNYCAAGKELLAIIFCLKIFRTYLLGRKFQLRTDHAALKWILNFKNPEGQVARWLEAMSEFQSEIVHQAGLKHNYADVLLRKPCKQCEKKEVKVKEDNLDEDPHDAAEWHFVNVLSIPFEYIKQEISELQRKDPDLRDLMTHFIDKHELNETDKSIWSPAI